MNILVIGPQGSGKGTYSDLISQDLKIPFFGTGDLFRENVKNSTPIGKLAKSYMDKGVLVPDDVTAKMLKERISRPDCKGGFILEGFPRNLAQAEMMKEIAKLDVVLHFVVREEVIIDRLSGRVVCKKCGATYHLKNIPPKVKGICDKCGGELARRDDDTPDAIKQRLEIYHTQTAPLIDYYKEILFDVDVNSSYDKRTEVIDALKKHLIG